MVVNQGLALAAELAALTQFRRFVNEVCREAGIDEAICEDIRLSTDEACANVIEHGYQGMDPGTILVELVIDSRRALVRITDFGHPFEPYEPEKPDVEAILEDLPTTGFGLYFIYQTMDQVTYETDEDGNRLTLIKKLI